MIVPHLYLNGRCEEAIGLYVKAFEAKINVIIRFPEPEKQKAVMHSEIIIHGQRVILNDDDIEKGDYTRRGYAQLVVIFENEEALRKSYETLKEGSYTISPLQSSIYALCEVEFWDKFGVFWGLMVSKN
jgi:PhnB protein